MQVVEQKSALVEAIEKQERRCWSFDAAEFMGSGFPRGLTYRMRVARVDEQSNALDMAKNYVSAKTKESDKAKLDPDIYGNAKIAYLMHAVCFDGEKNIPAFPSGKWLMEHLTVDQLAVLLNHYHEILRIQGPIDFDLSEERLEGLAALMAKHADTDAPNIALMPFTREQIAEMCVRLSMMLRDARKAASESQSPAG